MECNYNFQFGELKKRNLPIKAYKQNPFKTAAPVRKI